MYDLVVVGGGAAGFFTALTAAERKPGIRILILEKNSKLLSKVKVSGGGRCNVTHHLYEPTPFSKHYPRGQKELKQLFRRFQAQDMVAWLRAKGVDLKAEEDGRMFPITDNSQTIIDCFLAQARHHQIKILTQVEVAGITPEQKFFLIQSTTGNFQGKKVTVAAGGYNSLPAYQWIARLGHPVVPPIPSLFTFNEPHKKLKDLMGIAVQDAEVRIAGTKFSERGALLITHWGLSGPAVIKLSAWAAEYLHEKKYSFTAFVNWLGITSEDDLRTMLLKTKAGNGKKLIRRNPLFNLPARLWVRFCEWAEIPDEKIWAELPQKNINKLIEFLIRCQFDIRGKTTFKEEFVTCGGVDLNSINLETMESRLVPGLYFAGEVLNIDGETGGFNFQSAWTTAFIAGKAIAGS